MQRILVVEDSSSVREFVTQVLAAGGFEVDGAGDGLEALEKVCERPFDLILLDIWMPRMNGLEFLARLHSSPQPMKAIVMTGDDTPETLLRVLRQQACRYIRKPFRPQALIDLVREALADACVQRIEVLSAKRSWVELLVPCSLAAAERIQDFLSHLDGDLPPDVRDSVGKAFRELLLNAMEWGGQLDPTRQVRIACIRTPRMLLYRIADPGPGFKFEDLPHAAVSNPPERPSDHLRVREEKGMRPGGFGLMMARAMVDELVFNEAQNEVVFVKYLDQVSDQGSQSSGKDRE